MRFSVICVLSLFLTVVQAAEQSEISIKQVLPERNLAIAQSDVLLSVGSELIATFKDGHQCPLKVSKFKGNLATVDTSACKNANDLVAGQRLEISLFENDQTHSENSATLPVQTEHSEKPQVQSDYERDLTDILYQPPEGKFAGSIGYSYTQSSPSINLSATGQTIINSKVTTQSYDALFGFGFSNAIAVGIGLGWVPSSTENETFGAGSNQNGQSQSLTSVGVTNPYIEGQYRIIEQDAHPLNVDVSLAYAPNIGTAKTPTANTKGNMTTGSDTATIGAAVSRKDARVSYAAIVSYKLYGEMTSTDAETGVQTQSNTHNQLTGTIAIQFKINERVSLLGLFQNTYTSSESESTPGSSNLTTNSYTLSGVEAAALISIVPKKYVLKLDYLSTFPAVYSGTVGPTGISGSTSGSSYEISLLGEF